MNFFIPLIPVLIFFFPFNTDHQPSRPKITGVAHVRVYSKNLSASRKFYSDILGLGPGSAGCIGLARSCFAINDHQKIEVISAGNPPASNFLAEVAFATDDVARMRRYFLAHNIAVGDISRDADGAQHFELKDPEGHPLAFVQQTPKHSFTPAADQISTRLFHAGFVVRDSAVEDHFYRDLLGFRLYWHGGFTETGTDWEEIQVPDGNDWIEYMLNISPTADNQERGVQNHFSLGVPRMKPAFERLQAHGLKTTDVPEIGRDGKMQFDIFDPDATRVEFMEFEPSQSPCCNPYTAPHPKP